MTHLLQRRQCLAGLGGLLVAGLGMRPALASPDVHRASHVLMGTRVDIVAQGDNTGATATAVQAAFAEMQRLERMMSRYRADSLVSAMHRSAGRGLVEAPPELISVLQRAAELSRLSEGAFDITVGAYHGWSFDPRDARMPAPEELRRERRLVDFRDVLVDPATGQAGLGRPGMRIDLGGVAKLPILQAGLRVLEQHGLRHAMVNGGGDVLTRGQLQGQDWRVGIRDPRAPERLIHTVQVRDACVASSGDYERCFVRNGRRYHHLLDPRTGMPSRGVRGVVTVSRPSDPVNGLGAAIMVAGATAGRHLLSPLREVDSLIVDADDRVWRTG
ncbi:thiamine biosynthesis APBE transmembrane protein [Hydrogenophaga taeniospiralis CCUG 15921]|uniref:FAD:protein FMN transferase n=1 Tax=Hydrogenophaga taeniospiralis CCUG 15921 TaxID=1281780 RepID=A0A9X4NQ60_9BURK|nr:FAD:protein FMN transferase [Hydrogenophaga taeniospiralis]MDG5975147.1 thiamine biosynthesis APBE transmembrane protein [Hydrogenophaga taeniospiralis CCUG 15921]